MQGPYDVPSLMENYQMMELPLFVTTSVKCLSQNDQNSQTPGIDIPVSKMQREYSEFDIVCSNT